MTLSGDSCLICAIRILLCCALSYVVGSAPFGVWSVRGLRGINIQGIGSGNIGATNVARVLGPGWGAAIFILDAGKGTVGILVARNLWPGIAMPTLILIGACAILGHTFSVFLRFTGGKAVSTTVGVLAALHPAVAGISLALMLVMVAVWRYVSLAAITAAISMPVIAWFVEYPRPADKFWMVGLCAIVAIFIPIRHRDNIRRLLAGTESKVGERIETTK